MKKTEIIEALKNCAAGECDDRCPFCDAADCDEALMLAAAEALEDEGHE